MTAFPSRPTPSERRIYRIDLKHISPNPDQPRREFDEAGVCELAASIREHGLIQPLIVRKVNGSFELIAGERRLRAITSLGQTTAKVVVHEATDQEVAELALIEKCKKSETPVVLAINKIDMLKDKEQLLELILSYSALYNFEAVVPVCAVDGKGVNDLLDELKKLCSEGGHFFDDDALTDQPEKVLAAEMIREKILRLTDKEIPHGTAVVIERMRTREDCDILDIDATIYCERSTHKGIIIGKGGSMLKKISTYARQDMEKFFDCKVNLQTWVKVKEDWRNREVLLNNFGFNQKDFD